MIKSELATGPNPELELSFIEKGILREIKIIGSDNHPVKVTAKATRGLYTTSMPQILDQMTFPDPSKDILEIRISGARVECKKPKYKIYWLLKLIGPEKYLKIKMRLVSLM